MGQRFMSVVLAGLFGVGSLGAISATPAPAAAQTYARFSSGYHGTRARVVYRSPGVRVGFSYGAPAYYYGRGYYAPGYYYAPAYYYGAPAYYPAPNYYVPGGWIVNGGWWGYHDRGGRFRAVRRYR
jgi:hypothetical protein